jgi:hypothetical protein
MKQNVNQSPHLCLETQITNIYLAKGEPIAAFVPRYFFVHLKLGRVDTKHTISSTKTYTAVIIPSLMDPFSLMDRMAQAFRYQALKFYPA